MSGPEGKLTPVQYAILQLAWTAGDLGVTVTQVWDKVGKDRPVSRTTVQNLLDRLEERRWLRRRKRKDGIHYIATVAQNRAAQKMAREFVDDFFDGSPTRMMMSLLGSKRLDADEIEKLKQLLQKPPAVSNSGDEE